MELYLLKDKDGFYLAEMENYSEKVPVFGTVNPKTDGNYYKSLVISSLKGRNEVQYTLGMEGWLDWFLNQAIPNKWVLLSEEFPFDPKTLKIVIFKEIEK